MRLDKFGSQLDGKDKTWFFTLLNVYVSWIRRDKILISQITPPNEVPQQLGLEKQMKKMGLVSLVIMSHFWVMVFKLSKIVSFLQFFANVSKKSKAVIAIYV